MIGSLLTLVISLRKWIFISMMIFFLIFIYSWMVDQIVYKFIPAFSEVTSQRLNVRVIFDTPRYIFPNRIFLRNLKIFDSSNTKKPMIKIPRASFSFAFPLFSSQQKIMLSQVKLDYMSMRVPLVKEYLVNKGAALLSEIKSWPQGKVKVVLSDMQLYLLDDSKVVSPIVFDLKLSINKGDFSGELKDKNFYLQFWGNWQGSNLDWKGYMFYNGLLMKEPLYLLDMDGAVSVNPKSISLDKLSFSANGDEFLVNGRFFLDEPYDFNVKLSYNKQVRNINPQSPLKSINMDIQGKGQGMLLDGKMDFDLWFQEGANLPLQKLSFIFNNLHPDIVNDKLLQLKIQNLKASLMTRASEYQIPFDGFLLSLQTNKAAEFEANLSSQLYGGRYQGQVNLNTSTSPWQIKAKGKVDQIDINRLSQTIKTLSKCKGYVSASFDIQAPKDLLVSGNVSVHQADLQNIGFLPWKSSKNLQMPSLERLSNTDMFFRFRFNPNLSALEDIKLHASEMDLKGFFRLNSNALVSSKLAVLFSPKLFNESILGRKLTQLVPKAYQMPIELQLSGDLHQMSFQWDDSPLKQKVQARLPHFIENIIDCQVDTSTAS